MNDLEKETLAKTLWGEARGEGIDGMRAVANVIMNRVAISDQKGNYWWGKGIVGVCRKAWQFSCWNVNDPNSIKLDNLTEEDSFYVTALKVADEAISGCLVDKTKGSTHYHLVGLRPYWIKNEKVAEVIGNHIFYRIG